MESLKNNKIFLNMFKGVGIAFILTIICLTIFSILLVYTNLGENLIRPVVIVVTGVSILVGSCIANRKSKKNGILKGGIIGIIYIFLIYIISSVVNGGEFNLNLGSVIMMLVGIMGGAIGGIIGVNIG